MKRKLFFILFVMECFVTYSQYTTYNLEGVGSISVSDEMELQTGDYRTIAKTNYDAFSKKIGYSVDFNDRIVFQHKGVNSYQNLEDSYVRIIIETEYGSFNPLTSVKPTISVQEMQELNTFFKTQLEESFSGTPLKLLQFYGVSVEKINHQVALKMSYLRKLGDNPPAKVSMYQFENKNRVHIVTISCRVTDEAKYREVLEKSLHSLKINKQ